MLVGVPKEIKDHEYRVGLTPPSIKEVVLHGHQAIVETNAGAGIGATDADYEKAGATIAASASEVFEKAEMIVKVKEPQANERAMLKPDQVLFTYLHLAAVCLDDPLCNGQPQAGAIFLCGEVEIEYLFELLFRNFRASIPHGYEHAVPLEP